MTDVIRERVPARFALGVHHGHPPVRLVAGDMFQQRGGLADPTGATLLALT